MADPIPGADERTFTDEHFGAELFWEKNKSKIFAAAAALVLAGLGAIGWAVSSRNATLASETALAAADGPEAWAAVAEKFAGRPTAQVASLLLAESQRESGDLTASTATYQAMIGRQPDGPLAGLARLGLAGNAAAAGDVDRARSLYAEASASGGYAAPVAMLLSGSLLADNGEATKARTEFEALRAEFPDSIAARVASSRLQEVALILPPPNVAGALTTSPSTPTTPSSPANPAESPAAAPSAPPAQ